MFATVTTFDAPAVPLPPVPAPAASGRAGRAALPYPTGTDHLAQTARYLRDLAAATEAMVANPGLVMTAGSVTTDATGLVWLAFSGLVTLGGCVVCPMPGWGSASSLFPQMLGIAGNSIAVRWFYMKQGAASSDPTAPLPYPNISLPIWAMAWGSVA